VMTIMQDVLRASASRQCAWFGNGTSGVSGTWRVGYDLTIVAIIDTGGRVIAEWRSRLSNQIHNSSSRQSRLVFLKYPAVATSCVMCPRLMEHRWGVMRIVQAMYHTISRLDPVRKTA
jgi:hypothetical protein